MGRLGRSAFAQRTAGYAENGHFGKELAVNRQHVVEHNVRLIEVDNFENLFCHGQNLDFCPLCKDTL